MTTDKFYIYKRRLPHWRFKGSIYFVTWRLHPAQVELTYDERDELAAIIRHFDNNKYNLLAYVIMPDHIHVLLEPIDNHNLHKILHSWKSYSANLFQKKYHRIGSIWQDEYFDRIVRNDDELLQKADYIMSNPLKAWPDIQDYRWAWVRAGTEARPTDNGLTDNGPTDNGLID